jgi:guanylate kinase
MNAERLGQILVLCAPSGTGKSTLCTRLLAEFPGLTFSVSCTTRAPRGGERDGVDYHFKTREEFITLRDQGFFAEWAEVHGNFYGTPAGAVRDMLAAGRDVLFDIDVQGAAQLRRTFPDGLYVLLLPPSREELDRRLRGRGTDSEETIARRMANAVKEMGRADEFAHWIVNRDLEQAYGELRAVFLAGTTRPACRPDLVRGILDTFGPER